MISSPIVLAKGHPVIFGTNAPTDRFYPELAAIVDPDRADTMTASQRNTLLLENPVLAARLFKERIDAHFEFIIKGTTKPFGEITDTWIRVEFQARGTPHVHYILFVKDTEELASLDLKDP